MNESKSYNLRVKTKYFNNLEYGSIPQMDRVLLRVLNYMYDDGVLAVKPTKVSTYIDELDTSQGLKQDFRIDFVIG